ncbi:MAG: sporulation integral membrane protein YtvI [Ruminococcaceae bacterium]|nr:sporulation integral membrane protein YtvI [Oscillospiraceae bacterium]
MSQFSLRKLLLILISAAGLWLGVRFVLPIAMPFLLAALLALAAEPLVHGLNRHLHMSRGLAAGIGVSVALVLTVLLLLALCALLVRELGALAGVLPDLENATLSGLDSLEQWLLGLARRAPDGISSLLTHSVEGMFSSGSALLDSLASRLLNLAASLLKALPDSALGLGTWVLAAFMLSARLPRIRAWLTAHLPAAWHARYAPYLQTLKKTVAGWLTAQAKLVGITFCILTVGFFLLQIDHPLLWAAATCLVDILPVLGTGTVLIPWSLVCFLQGSSLQGVGLLAIYAVISLLRSVLEPRLVGKQLGLDPLVTLLAIYAGYRLWGLPGMLIAPVLAVAATQILLQTKKQP